MRGERSRRRTVPISTICWYTGTDRYSQYKKMREMIDQYEGSLDAFSRGYEKFGFER
ncbi:hypothetical protein GW17_00003084, partial [Ensete ventricosum]